MADQADPDDPRTAGESPVLLEVTVSPGPRGGGEPGRVGRSGLLGLALAALALALLVGGVVGVVAGRTSRRAERPAHAQASQAANAGPLGVAAAYQYPLACLSVTIAPADPAYAAARLDRASPCWRYGAYVTAIFRRVAGVWRMALQTSGASCRVASIPAVVRTQLGLCAAGDRARAVLNDWDLPRALVSAGSE